MFDLMVWNADATRVPTRMHSEYLQQLFLDNELVNEPYRVNGFQVSLHDIRVPILAAGTLSDHATLWRPVCKIHSQTNADATVVLSDDGHNVGTASHPAKHTGSSSDRYT